MHSHARSRDDETFCRSICNHYVHNQRTHLINSLFNFFAFFNANLGRANYEDKDIARQRQCASIENAIFLSLLLIFINSLWPFVEKAMKLFSDELVLRVILQQIKESLCDNYKINVTLFLREIYFFLNYFRV